MSIHSPQNLTRDILIAMLAGTVTGLFLNSLDTVLWIEHGLVQGAFSIGGSIFINCLKMLVVPLVFVSLICGVCALGDPKLLGRLGGKTLVIYLATTALAISLALTTASVFAPGEGFNLTTDLNFVGKEVPSIPEMIAGMFPTNPIAAMASGDMLQVIIFALFLGTAITLTPAHNQQVVGFFTELNSIMLNLVSLVMRLAPIGIFCLLAKTFTELGFDVLLALLKYFLVMAFTLLAHALITYSLLLRTFTGMGPVYFFSRLKEVLLFAFSTSSSSATLPVTLRVVENKLGVDNKIASFTLPLGATINMDGTVIMQGVATVFIAQVYQVDLAMSDYIAVVATATLASIGTAGIPSVGLAMLSMVLVQVGLPVEGIALIIGVDRLLDMIRTAVNVTGDAAITCIVAHSEKSLKSEVV